MSKKCELTFGCLIPVFAAALWLGSPCPGQPTGKYLPHGGKSYLVNYGAIKGDLFRIDFAARQFCMIDEQAGSEGRRIRAITPGMPVLLYRCLVSSYPDFAGYDTVLNIDERCFIHSCDPAGLHISHRSGRVMVSWLNDRRYGAVAGYHARISSDSTALGQPVIDTTVASRILSLDSSACAGKFIQIGTKTAGGGEAWYSFSTRIDCSTASPVLHHFADTIFSAAYASARDTLYLQVNIDNTAVADSVILQLDLNHDKNPAGSGERFAFGGTGSTRSIFRSWDRSGYNAGTGFRILIYQQSRIDTLPGGAFLMTTNINNRTRSDPYGNELMNPCDPTWQNFTVNAIVTGQSAQDYHGVFTDNTTLTIQSWMYEVPSVYRYDDPAWQNGMGRFLRRIDSATSPSPVFFNGLGQLESAALLPFADGGMFEGWEISTWSGYASESFWKSSETQVLTTRSTYHKIFLALSQAPAADTNARMFVYGSYLLTCDDSVWFANAAGYSLFAHFPEMNINLGRPLASAATDISELRQASGCYARPFERGTVFVNPTTTNCALSGSYPANLVVVSPGTTLEGSTLRTVPFTGTQIGPQRTLVLLNAPASSPAITSVSLSPAQPTDSGSNRIMAKVTGLQPLYVEASLTSLAGPAHLTMNDMGINGDTKAGDSIFTGTFALPIGSSASDDTIRVLAFDTTGLASVAALRAASHPRDTFNVVPNWSFEYDLDKDNIPDSWHGYGGGFIYDTTGVNAHSGTRSVHCSASIADSSHGVYTTVRLDQSAAADLTLCGWSKAANVFGNKDNNYALYVDVTYTDGTPLYGRCAQFDVGTHDWQFSTYTIKPLKPIRQLTLYCMFRSHSGDVWFDHLAVQKASAPVQNRVFHTAQPVFLGARSVCRGVLVRYETLQKEKVSVVVLDPSGRMVKRLIDKTQSPGTYSILWNAGNDGGRVAGSGVYLIKLVTGNRSEVAKVFLMR